MDAAKILKLRLYPHVCQKLFNYCLMALLFLQIAGCTQQRTDKPNNKENSENTINQSGGSAELLKPADLVLTGNGKTCIASIKTTDSCLINMEQVNRYLHILGGIPKRSDTVKDNLRFVVDEMLYYEFYYTIARQVKFDTVSAVIEKIHKEIGQRRDIAEVVCSKIKEKSDRDAYLAAAEIGNDLYAKRCLATSYFIYLMQTTPNPTKKELDQAEKTGVIDPKIAPQSLGYESKSTNIDAVRAMILNNEYKRKKIIVPFEEWKKKVQVNL
jgi:hypothetical protein